MAGYFYAFASEAVALEAGAMVPVEDGSAVPAADGAVVTRSAGIEIERAVLDPETGAIITPATLSAPLVVLSPTMMPGCSSALVVPCDHVGFA